MVTKAQQKRDEVEQARETLRGMLNPGDTVTTQVKHRSQSGMMRVVSVLVADGGEVRDISGIVGIAIGGRWNDKHWGIAVGGCGFDAGFDVAYSLGRALWSDKLEFDRTGELSRPGFYCIGKGDRSGDARAYRGCPSNDHSNERGADYEKGFDPERLHSDSGYALGHRSL